MCKFVYIFFFFLNVTSYAKGATILDAKYLYKLTSNHSGVRYLYGSSHVSVSNIPIQMDQCVKDIFLKTDHVYLEADQLAVRSFFSASRNMVSSMSSVAKYLDESTITLIAEKIFGKQVDAVDKLLNMDALLLFNILSSNIPGILKLLGLPDYGLDAELTMSARFLNKKIDYIETPEDQLRFFQITPPEAYAAAIASILKLLKNESDAISYLNKNFALARAAANGDEEAIVSEMKFDGFSEFNKYTITDRNESITDKIVSRLSENKDKSAFIALGAAHLAGEGSVVQRLKAKGYTATRLCQ